MLFRGPYLKFRSWKQSLLQLIQEIRNHVEMYRPSNTTGVDIPAARVVAIVADGSVALSDADGATPWADGVTEEVIVDGDRGRVRNTGLVRVQLPALVAPPPVAGMAINISNTAGLGTTAKEGSMIGRVYDASDYATDETVIIRLTCCEAGAQ